MLQDQTGGSVGNTTERSSVQILESGQEFPQRRMNASGTIRRGKKQVKQKTASGKRYQDSV